MERYLDLRILKTRQELYKALFEIMKDKAHNLEKIKVVDVCQKAAVSTITFYKHFDNSSELIENAIKDQIGNKLPIPLKLKPQGLKQLIIYLIQFLANYFASNKEVIANAFAYASNRGFKGTYIDILFKLLIYYVKQEINIIYKYEENITTNIWSELIVGALFYLFINRLIKQRLIESNLIISKVKLMNCILNK